MAEITVKSGQALIACQPMNIADISARVDALVAETDATIAAHPRKAKQPKGIADLDSSGIYRRWNKSIPKAEPAEGGLRQHPRKPKTLSDLVGPAYAKWNSEEVNHGHPDD